MPGKRPKIFPQNERSTYCGACATATVLDWFDITPDPIPALYAEIRGESSAETGLYPHDIQSWFLRRDWIAIIGDTDGPLEIERDGKRVRNHAKPHQRIATWRCIKAMLAAGFLCMLDFHTVARTRHFAVVYDAFVRKNVHWLRIACSSQGYMEVQAESFLTNEAGGTSNLYVKPDNLELR